MNIREESATPVATTNAAPVEYGLDPKLGAIPTENLRFKPKNDYIERQNQRASKVCTYQNMGAKMSGKSK